MRMKSLYLSQQPVELTKDLNIRLILEGCPQVVVNDFARVYVIVLYSNTLDDQGQVIVDIVKTLIVSRSRLMPDIIVIISYDEDLLIR